MADVKWIKIVTDIFDDEKVLLIEQMPDGYAIITAWFKLLCLAGKQNNSGVFTINNKIPYTDEMFASIFRMQLSTVRLALGTFERFGMVEIVNNTVTIPNWGKHQSLDKITQRNEYMKKYMSGYREKQKALAGDLACKVNSKSNSKVNVSALELEEELEGELEERTRSRSSESGGGDMQVIREAAVSSGLPWHPANQNHAKKLMGKHGMDLLTQAIERTARRDKQNWGVVEGILDSWQANGGPDDVGPRAEASDTEHVKWVTHDGD